MYYQNEVPLKKYATPEFKELMEDVFGFNGFMNKTNNMAKRKELEDCARRIEEDNNRWLMEKEK